MDWDELRAFIIAFAIIAVIIAFIFGLAKITDVDLTNRDVMSTKYESLIIYNNDMTEVLYSTGGCKIEEINGKLIVITGIEKDN